MECPICYDAITSQTGIVTTSCGHSYHFACISSWFMTQEENSTCPCCRKEMCTIEDLPYTDGDIEDEEDSDDAVEGTGAGGTGGAKTGGGGAAGATGGKKSSSKTSRIKHSVIMDEGDEINVDDI